MPCANNPNLMKTLTQMAVDVLTTADGRAKAALSRSYAAQWQAARANGEDVVIGNVAPPDQPASIVCDHLTPTKPQKETVAGHRLGRGTINAPLNDGSEP